MAWQYSVLVVANVTADAPELLQALDERAGRDTCQFTLLVPAPAGGKAGREAAGVRLEAALEKMREQGLEVEGQIGDQDPIIAVHEMWDPKRFDEIVVSTLPTGSSKWLQVDLPRRVEKMTGVQVQHVVCPPPAPQPRAEPVPKRERYGILTPFAALAGGARRRRARRARERATAR
jgi:hypothetical protein